MNNWKVIFAAAVIFGAGVLAGGVLVNCKQRCSALPGRPAAAKPATNAPPVVNVATNPVTRPAETNKPPRLPEVLSKQFLQSLDAELQLTPEQRKAIQKIINEGQNLMRKTVQDARLEMRETLTAEQRKQFDDLMKRKFHKPLAVFGTNAPAATGSPTNPSAAK